MTRSAILEVAKDLASRMGLGGLTIGRLADDLAMSKSGLFAHFRSKEALQLDVLEAGREAFVHTVVKPALAEPRGEPRIRALFERLLACRTRLGLLSEDLDPATGELWGNFPQTYSMVGLIHSAMRLSKSWDEGLWRVS